MPTRFQSVTKRIEGQQQLNPDNPFHFRQVNYFSRHPSEKISIRISQPAVLGGDLISLSALGLLKNDHEAGDDDATKGNNVKILKACCYIDNES
jgi:hypothetical protein